ncbi:MarR family transcriptional regulator [bacterium]|nr:MarR family transcriptional regulator [bacterium]
MRKSPHDSIGFWTKLIFIAFRKRMNKSFEDMEIGAGEAMPLLGLHFFGSRSLVEISKHLAHSHPAILRHIDALEKKGLVERVSHPEDRRMKIVQITEKGKSVAPKAFSRLWKVHETAVTGLGEEEIMHLLSLLKQVYSNLVGEENKVFPACLETPDLSENYKPEENEC